MKSLPSARAGKTNEKALWNFTGRRALKSIRYLWFYLTELDDSNAEIVQIYGKSVLSKFSRCAVKVPMSSNFLFAHLILHFMQWKSAKKIFDLDKKRFCYECLNTWKSYFLAVDPCRWSQHRHAQSCDVDSGTCDFRLDLSCLFYLCKFSFVVHAKCSFPACCMNY